MCVTEKIIDRDYFVNLIKVFSLKFFKLLAHPCSKKLSAINLVFFKHLILPQASNVILETHFLLTTRNV